MDAMTILALSACVLSAGVVYVVLKIDYSGRTQALTDQLLAEEAELNTVKKQLQGYTRYADYLTSVVPSLAERLKPPVLTITREFTQVDVVAKAKYKLRADVTLVSKYKVTFGFALDMTPALVALTQHTNGVAAKLNRPTLTGEPKVELLAQQVISAQPPTDDRALLAEARANFQATLRTTAAALCDDPTVRGACKLKFIETLRDTLAQQPGVRQVPALFVEFR
ncbi:MAG: hypothetical protein AUJ20_01005 [Comamonadaceae bacterium CG1_02_60_18]|nr:MAG: hypothetical protein AUJ20_01005 [Comamonadaceae bacterium CG1_02_60_18]